MTTLLILSPTGGSGKSTMVRTLAAAAAGDGISVTILDADPQGTTAKWCQRRAEIDGIPRIEGKTIDIERASKLIAACSGLVLIDTPTAIEAYPEAISALITASDMVLIPSQPLPDDVDSVSKAMRLANELGKPALYVLNRSRSGVKEADAARMKLARSGDVAAIAIPDSVAIVRAMGMGYGPSEVAGRGTEESGALWAEIKRRIGL